MSDLVWVVRAAEMSAELLPVLTRYRAGRPLIGAAGRRGRVSP